MQAKLVEITEKTRNPADVICLDWNGEIDIISQILVL